MIRIPRIDRLFAISCHIFESLNPPIHFTILIFQTNKEWNFTPSSTSPSISRITTSIVSTISSNTGEATVRPVQWRDQTYELRLDIILPMIVCLLILSAVLVFLRTKVEASGLCHHFLPTILIQDPTRANVQSTWKGPDSDPPPDYIIAVNMPSPQPTENRWTSDLRSPTSSYDNHGVIGESNRSLEIREAFVARISESDDVSFDDDTINMQNIVSESGQLSNMGILTNPVCTDRDTSVTNEIVAMTNNDNGELGPAHSADNVDTEVSTNPSISEDKQHELRITIVDLHKMEYDPYSSPCHLPSYEEYVKEVQCVHL